MPPPPPPPPPWSWGDLRDPAGLDRLLAGVDAVVHAAAIPAPVDSDVFDNNVGSTCRVLDAAGAPGVHRIVFVSSLSAVGLAWSQRAAAPLRVPVTEDHPPDTVAPVPTAELLRR